MARGAKDLWPFSAKVAIFNLDGILAHTESSAAERALHIEEVSLRPGALIFIRALRLAGVPVALIAQKTVDELAEISPRLNLDDVFDIELTAEDVPVPFDEPDIYLSCAGALGAEPKDCLVFEGTERGCIAAHTAGMQACIVCTEDSNQDAYVSNTDVEFCIKNWKDIPLP